MTVASVLGPLVWIAVGAVGHRAYDVWRTRRNERALDALGPRERCQVLAHWKNGRVDRCELDAGHDGPHWLKQHPGSFPAHEFWWYS